MTNDMLRKDLRHASESRGRGHASTAFVSAAVVSAVLAGSGALSGCFFDRMQKSEESDIQRVQQKQAILETEQSSSATLKQQESMLTAELSEREFTMDELNQRVQSINAQNGRALAGNATGRAQYEALLDRVHETNMDLAAARRGTADSIEGRRERIAFLRSRLKAEVDSLFP